MMESAEANADGGQRDRALIRAAIPDAEVTIPDLAGDGDHYAARVVSALLPE